MKKINLNITAAPSGVMALVKTALLTGVLMAVAATSVVADPMEKKGTTPYVTHFVFRPLESMDLPGFKATALEAVGTTENMNGEKMLDKMAARCVAVNIETGPKKYIDGACVLADSDGDQIFSTFDTRDVDKSMGGEGCLRHPCHHGRYRQVRWDYWLGAICL